MDNSPEHAAFHNLFHPCSDLLKQVELLRRATVFYSHPMRVMKRVKSWLKQSGAGRGGRRDGNGKMVGKLVGMEK
jgi:hypothetical protein